MKAVGILFFIGILGIAKTSALPQLPLPGNVVFSEYIAASMTGFFFNYIRQNNLDPTPPTHHPFDISVDGVNASIDGFQFYGLTRGLFVPYAGPTCLKERTFTVRYCVANNFAYSLYKRVFSIRGYYNASGTYGSEDDKVTVQGSGEYSARTHESLDPVFAGNQICHWVDYSNISVSPLGKVDISEATYTTRFSVTDLDNPNHPITIRLVGLSAGKYEEAVKEALKTNIGQAVGNAGIGNPLSELVDSFLRSLLGSTDSLDGASSHEDYLRIASKALNLPRDQASPVSGILTEVSGSNANKQMANGCFLG